MGRPQLTAAWGVLIAACLAARAAAGFAADAGFAGDAWSLDMEEVHPGQGMLQSRGRSLLEISTVKGLPNKFTIRPIVDDSLCVTRVTLPSAKVEAAREGAGLPPTSEEDVREYGAARLVLMPCQEGADDTFLAESVMGRFYFNNGTNYRQGFLKPPTNNDVCLYGVNASYTVGHPVWGVTGTEFYEEHPDKAGGALVQPLHVRDAEDADELDWFDDYSMEFASYTRYGYDPNVIFATGTFRSPNPLPLTALDASGWGPFHASWGPCMKNPTLDSATPTTDPANELQLRYQSFIFLSAGDTASISNLPAAARRQAYTLLTLGPDRPQPDMDPDAGKMDAGELSNQLGGSDKPYGTGYANLVSRELCMSIFGAVREGAQVRYKQCNPVSPALMQVFRLVPRRPRAAKKIGARAAKKAKA
ncbi:hypothetical protein HYH03_016358 [Edaphochlamys debaryana]|uniref:Uncharacterized protein n=1 Tax=Edaphochlamys debaryana TaxID=47281 RepID=A0A835XK14_9CHLO|nr:hypothetical protein HYH03_016358 [Edaphochlamys debaryana]|eukprot:KAG2484874.1 hypothetical protein HYH03_016358 [Edaphochlamys debaryana]